MSHRTRRSAIDDDDFPGPGPGPGPRPAPPADPSRRDLLMEPVGFGFHDVTEPRMRIYYPSFADGVRDAMPRIPSRTRTYPVVLFIHGQRSEFDGLCPSDVTQDFKRWDSSVRLVARCGFVVVFVDVNETISADPTRSAAAAVESLRWVRTQWRHRVIVNEPPSIVDPDRPPPLPNVGVIGHSWGALTAARLGRERRVRCIAAVCGTWDDPADLREARLPTLLIGATDDIGASSNPLSQPFCGQAVPVHQATLLDIGHFDLSGIHECGAPRPRAAVGSRALASDMLAVFLHRYLYHDSRLPPSLFARRGQRPSLNEFLAPAGSCAVRARWRDPFTDDGALGTAGRGRWPTGVSAWREC